MGKHKMDMVDGNFAAAHVAYAMSDAAFIYPITPSSPMAETAEAWSGAGRKNVFDQSLKVTIMQSEAGAAGAVHGSLSAGACTTTFTASQGLLLMLPNMLKIAGELMPAVFHVAARALAGQALSIFGDHSDVMTCRTTGFALLSSATVQETMDMALVAHLSTLRSSIPFIHFFEGFRLSHEINKIELIDYEDMKKLVPWEAVKAFRERALNPTHPHMRGTAEPPEIFMQLCEASNKYYNAVPDIVKMVFGQVAELTGRKYQIFDYFGHPEADRIIVCMGAAAPIVRETLNYLNERGEKTGLIVVRLYRPWVAKDFYELIPKSVERIAVLDRTKEAGSFGEPLYLDVAATLQEFGDSRLVVGGRFGLGSKDFTPTMAKAVFDSLKQDKPVRHFTVGINDDVTHTSLPMGPIISTVPPKTVECMFWGLGSDGTVGANKNSIKIIGDNTPLQAQAYFAYDAHKSGGVTVSHLRFGPEKIYSSYLISHADFVAVHHPTYVNKYDVAKTLKKNGTFLLNCPWDDAALETALPNKLKKALAEKGVSVYKINALEIATSVGLGKRTNSVLQTCFFKLANVIPFEEVVPLLKGAIEKTFSKKGPEVVKMNKDAIDKALDGLIQVKYDKAKWLALPEVPLFHDLDPKGSTAETMKYVTDVMQPTLHLEGDAIPVSKFTPGGIQPMTTTKFEKRGIAASIPVWDAEKCTECNYCSVVCPHAAIRPFLATEDQVENAPDEFVCRHTRAAEVPGMLYRIQVSPYDCTGCELCVQACPDDALKMVPFVDPIMTVEDNNWNFAIDALENQGEKFDPFTVKGSQFQVPLLEFSGACEGCGETPYIKMMTQLFGERMIIANATGCSSIWGGSAPVTPYAEHPKTHRGPAWANSLFEDNAEYGIGMTLAIIQRRAGLADLCKRALSDPKVSGPLKTVLMNWVTDRLDAAKADLHGNQLLQMIPKEKDGVEILESIWQSRDLFPKMSHWIVGGDGWAYDIGYGGLDHVMALGEDVNIIVLDTEMYSNTGGQVSKSTPLGSVAKFAATGKRRNKKNLGERGMSYGDVYVAQIAMSANMNQAVKALQEAERHPGTSLTIAYAPCIEHGMPKGMKQGYEEQKMAVDSGYWTLFRYNPLLEKDGKNPFTLDSPRLKTELAEFLKRENRYVRLARSHPELSKELQQGLSDFVKERHEKYVAKAQGAATAAFGQLKAGIAAAPDLLVLYASETGNAEDVARRLATEAELREISVRVTECDAVEVDELKDSKWVIVVASTCGQGEIPDNGKTLYKDLSDSKLDKTLLEGLKFGVFGLGDSSYVFFNKAAKAYEERLLALGAAKLIPTGMGDDQDLDKFGTALDEWEPEFWNTIGAKEPPAGIPDATRFIEVVKEKKETKPFLPHGAVWLKLDKTELLTPEGYDRDMRTYSFNLKGTGFRYNLTDSLAVYPRNKKTVVDEFLTFYKLNGDDVIHVKEVNPSSAQRRHLPEFVTIRQLFAEILDIAGRPGKRFFKAIAPFADFGDQAILEKLVSKEGKADFEKMLKEDMPTFFDVLKRFPSIKPGLAHLADLIPMIRPRAYSIASSYGATPDTLDLCVVLVDWYVKEQRKEGLCTGFLKSLDPVNGKPEDLTIACALQQSGINLPLRRTAPMVMAGLGTGMAPYRAIVLDTAWRKANNKPHGPLALYYGCRHKKTEFLYGDMLEKMNKEGVLTHLKPAFSRDQDFKIYVQDKISGEPEIIYDMLITNNGYFYYCGPAGRAPEDCRKAVVGAIAKIGKKTQEEAEAIVTEMQIRGHYSVEAY